MRRMACRIVLFSSLNILILIIHSCRKDEVPNFLSNTIEKYILEIDNNFNIYKVSFSSSDFNRDFIIEYVYSTGSIRKTVTRYGEFGVNSVTIFYLNNFGLADSSHVSHYLRNVGIGTTTYYFLYDSNNYLEMSITKIPNFSYQPPDTTFYDNDNGNLIKITYPGTNFPTSSAYNYNSKKNFIDIKSFNGGFLGILNQNLIESFCDYGLPEYSECFRYEYIMYSNGLVKERRTIYNIDRKDYLRVEEFEYIIR